jgi:hypothetical protein
MVYDKFADMKKEDKDFLLKKQRKSRIIIIASIVVLFVIVVSFAFWANQGAEDEIEEPTSGIYFYDDIVLMQSGVTGEYSCFGCVLGDPGFCKDPTPDMNPVEGSLERYCDDEFEVVVG